MKAGDAARPAEASPLPEQIGRYRILERIGKGAMGVVYRARDEQLGRTVALKVLMTDFAEEPDVRARFYREAQSAGRLLHRNIITIFDLGDDRGRAYIVMELLAGATLSDFMARPEAADLETKMGLMIQVCDGLSAAHAAGIIHRDVKPGNLFVLNDGGLKILDFGVARLVTSSMTVRGHIIGTPSYMSPEQATGRQIDHRSDIFSAGGVFYWMLSGRKPFAAADLPSVLRKVQFEDPPALRDEDAPPPLARIVFRALAKDPAQRYQRISDMLGDLQRFSRQYEADSLRLGALAQEHVQAVRALEEEMAGQRARLGAGAPERSDPFAPLLARHPLLAECGLASLGALAFHRAVTLQMLADIEQVRALAESDAALLRKTAWAEQAETERRTAAAAQESAGRAAEAASRRAGVAELLERARIALDNGALRQAAAVCHRIDALEPGNPDAAALKAEAERRAGRVRDALARAREARRVERAVLRRLAVARMAVRLGRFRPAYDAATAALASMPGHPYALAIRDAAAAAIGVGPDVDGPGGEPWAAGEETVGTDTTVAGRAPD